MKKVLYITNIETPYRVKFFNLLAERCDLTVLYERENSSNRDKTWAKSEKCNHHRKYLKGINIGNESSFSFGILKEIFRGYEMIIVGCYNSPVQMLAMLAMRIIGMKYTVNLDGEPFLGGTSIKAYLKRFFLSGAHQYVVAGEKAAQSVRDALGVDKVIPYYFSSMTEAELAAHRMEAGSCTREDTILVVGQYLGCKGIDVALEAARMDPQNRYKFVGMGRRTELFCKDFEGRIPANVEIVPFLQKKELEEEYKNCALLVLPSRQECWGLVINEAASFGTPIVSTWGSGAAVEFLAEQYPEYLAEPGDAESLLRSIKHCLNDNCSAEIGEYLLHKSTRYSIENNVVEHLKVLSIDDESDRVVVDC